MGEAARVIKFARAAVAKAYIQRRIMQVRILWPWCQRV